MDISKMYCRVDSEHFDEFVKLVGEQFGEFLLRYVTDAPKNSGCVAVVANGWMDEVEWYEKSGYTEFTGSWSVYSNTKPLSELTDSQAAELFNWWRNGGEIKLFTASKRWVVAGPSWSGGMVYRAKQKSERDLFIEAAAKIMFDVEGGGHEINDITLGALFDAEFKAPKGGE